VREGPTHTTSLSVTHHAALHCRLCLLAHPTPKPKQQPTLIAYTFVHTCPFPLAPSSPHTPVIPPTPMGSGHSHRCEPPWSTAPAPPLHHWLLQDPRGRGVQGFLSTAAAPYRVYLQHALCLQRSPGNCLGQVPLPRAEPVQQCNSPPLDCSVTAVIWSRGTPCFTCGWGQRRGHTS